MSRTYSSQCIAPVDGTVLLLIAAWQTPQYHKIALEFTMDEKAITVETLVSELEKQRLLTAHLNQAGTGPARSSAKLMCDYRPLPPMSKNSAMLSRKGNAIERRVLSFTRRRRMHRRKRTSKKKTRLPQSRCLRQPQRQRRRNNQDHAIVVGVMLTLPLSVNLKASVTIARKMGINKMFVARKRRIMCMSK